MSTVIGNPAPTTNPNEETILDQVDTTCENFLWIDIWGGIGKTVDATPETGLSPIKEVTVGGRKGKKK